jgi:hypothetical protein
MIMKATHVKAILVVLAIFALGLFIGWTGRSYKLQHQISQIAAAGHPPLQKFFIKRMNQKLDLTDDQQAQALTVLGETEDELYQLLHASRIEFADIMTRMTTRLKTHLTPEQQQQVDENFGRFLELWQIPPESEPK